MTTRVAMVGAGSVARRHVAVLAGLGGARVVAVAGPVEQEVEALARECEARGFASLEQALDTVDVDAVYVCVPPYAHGAAEKAALARGLPVFVEKPVAVDVDTAEELAALVVESGVVTATGYHWRCLDAVSEARELLRDAPPLLANGYWLDTRPPVAWWCHTHLSGGQVVEQLTHVLDLARLLLGDVEEVYAVGARRHADETERDGDVDDATAATVRFTSGAVASFTATSVLTTKHRAALHTISPGLLLEFSESSLVVDDGNRRTSRLPVEDPRVTVDREFLQAVRGERAHTRTPYAEAVATHRVACAIAASVRDRRPHRVDCGEVSG